MSDLDLTAELHERTPSEREAYLQGYAAGMSAGFTQGLEASVNAVSREAARCMELACEHVFNGESAAAEALYVAHRTYLQALGRVRALGVTNAVRERMQVNDERGGSHE